MASRPRVLMVGPFPPTTGGVTTFMANVMGSALAETFEFIPFTTSRPPKPNTTGNWGYSAVLKGGVGRLLQGALVTLGHLISFPFVVAARKAALVQVNASDYFTFWESALYVLMAKALGRPVLMRLGGAFDHFFNGSSAPMKRLIGRAIEAPDVLIVQSAYWREFVSAAGRTKPVLVLNNFVDEGLIGEAARPSGGPPLFLFICGNEAERKGAFVLIEAMKRLAEAGCEARFLWLATPEPVRKALEDAGLAGRCEIQGFVPRDAVLHAMRSADAFLLPSFGEGFPNSLVEAMAAGLPAIATPVGAVPEIVEDGRSALVVPVDDPMALADLIADLASRPDRRLSIGQAARATVKARFVSSVVMPRLGEAYRSLLTR